MDFFMPETQIKKKMATGRPTKYKQKVVNLLCEQLSLGRSLRSVCKDETMPSIATVFNWLRVHKDFLEQYTRAKEESADALIEEILDISDETIQVIKSGAEKKSGAYAQAQRLRVDTRKWIASKLKPKKFGEKVDVTSDGKAIKGNTIIFTDYTDATTG